MRYRLYTQTMKGALCPELWTWCSTTPPVSVRRRSSTCWWTRFPSSWSRTLMHFGTSSGRWPQTLSPSIAAARPCSTRIWREKETVGRMTAPVASGSKVTYTRRTSVPIWPATGCSSRRKRLRRGLPRSLHLGHQAHGRERGPTGVDEGYLRRRPRVADRGLCSGLHPTSTLLRRQRPRPCVLAAAGDHRRRGPEDVAGDAAEHPRRSVK